tara:strand:- start:385 stop:1842 length:1458 start_codon:yes stop_codon:yes gene_type:complete
MNSNQQAGFSLSHRWSGWINLCFSVISVLILAIAFNCFSYRHYQRASWADNLQHKLSARTEQLLTDMTNEVDIIVFYDRTESTYRMVDELLQKYKHINKNLTINSIDPLQHPKLARKIQAKFRLSEEQNNVVIFSANKRHKIISQGQLSRVNLKTMERSDFLGERLFTSALLAVSSNEQPTVYCLTGHGEHSITNLNSSGYGEFGQLLGEMNTRVRDLSLQQQTTVPGDCRLLIIPGPKTELNLEEQRSLNQYLVKGGRLLVLLNHRSNGGIKSLLRYWGLSIGDNTVLDPDNTLGDGSITLRNYVYHPVVQALQKESLPVRLLLPRTVSTLPESDPLAAKQKMQPLIQTGPKGNAYRNFLNNETDSKPVLEAGPGSLPVAAVVERDTLAELKTDDLARIIVIGDSLFLSNQMIDKEGNRELAWHSVNWLLDRSNLLKTIGPQPIKTYRFEFKANEFSRLAVILIGIMPVGTLAIGILVWLRRRT